MSSPIQNKGESREQRLDRWLAPLRDNDVWLEDEMNESHATMQTRRAVQIQKLSELVRQVPARKAQLRRKSQWMWGVSSAAALVLAVLGTVLAQSHVHTPAQAVATAPDAHLRQFFGQVVARREAGATEILQPGANLHDGDELSTTAEAFASLDIGHARIDMASATTLELLRTEPHDQAYKLRAGRVDVSIPRVPGKERSFAIITSDTTVRVRGTVFSVEVDTEHGLPLTRVQVTRGSVSVEQNGSSAILSAGERWSSQVKPSIIAVEPQPPTERRAETAVGTSEGTSGSALGSDPGSSLADQNQLFAKALSAQRKGNHALAANLYGRLLKRYPDSPLGPTARTELAEVKRQLNQAGGTPSAGE